MKKFIGYLGILVLILGFGGMARATTMVTFNFDPPALPDDSNATAIGTYMSSLYLSGVSVTGKNGPVSETTFLGFDTLLGSKGDGYIESESLNGDHLIQINFTVPITSVVSFDYGQIADEFYADYYNGSDWINFFHTGWDAWKTGHYSGTFPTNVNVYGLRFHDDGLGEVGIDNLVVNGVSDPPTGVPEPSTLLFLGLGLLGLVSIRKFKKL